MILNSGSSDSRLTLVATLSGAGLAAIALIALAIVLLSTEGASAKVLVAVWLWLLPALGIGAAFGWLVAEVMRTAEAPMKALDRLGAQFETTESVMADFWLATSGRALLLGIGMALTVIAGGILTFIAVLVILVEGFA